MSLTNEDKQVLTQLHLDKCRACFADGEQLSLKPIAYELVEQIQNLLNK